MNNQDFIDGLDYDDEDFFGYELTPEDDLLWQPLDYVVEELDCELIEYDA